MKKTQIIEESLQCFRLGLAGLVPVLGLPFGVGAVGQYYRVRRGQGLAWNPARHYLAAGLWCAMAGLLVNFLVFGVLGIAIADRLIF